MACISSINFLTSRIPLSSLWPPVHVHLSECPIPDPPLFCGTEDQRKRHENAQRLLKREIVRGGQTGRPA
eukprot:2979729-Rhodomonas_salina.1